MSKPTEPSIGYVVDDSEALAEFERNAAQNRSSPEPVPAASSSSPSNINQESAPSPGGGISKDKVEVEVNDQNKDEKSAEVVEQEVVPYPLFKDCGGLEKQIGLLNFAILGPLKEKGDEPKRFKQHLFKGILFHGKPGTGKSLLAQALVNELEKETLADVIQVKPADILSPYLGYSSAILREVFEEAIVKKPTVVFIDDLDGLCTSRDLSTNGSSSQQSMLMTTLLSAMDNLPEGEVFVVATTSKKELLDPALIRSGRFDKHIEFLSPAEGGRRDILRIHTDNWKVKPCSLLISEMARMTAGFTGAELSQLCREVIDIALDRVIDGEDLGEVNLDSLAPTDEDWFAAVRIQKKHYMANASSFSPDSARAVYMPRYELDDKVRNLVNRNILQLEGVVQTKMEQIHLSNPMGTTSSSLHVWMTANSHMTKLEDFIMAPILSENKVLNKTPTYYLSVDLLASVPVLDLPAFIDNVFLRARASGGPSILYVQEVERLWHFLECAPMGRAISLERQIESLRGSHVLLLTTGIDHPYSMSYRNPFRPLCVATGDIQIPEPTFVDRLNFFHTLTILEGVLMDLSDEGREGLQRNIYATVEATDGEEVGPIVMLYNNIQLKLLHPSATDVGSVFGVFAECLSAYGMHRSYHGVSERPVMDPALDLAD